MLRNFTSPVFIKKPVHFGRSSLLANVSTLKKKTHRGNYDLVYLVFNCQLSMVLIMVWRVSVQCFSCKPVNQVIVYYFFLVWPLLIGTPFVILLVALLSLFAPFNSFCLVFHSQVDRYTCENWLENTASSPFYKRHFDIRKHSLFG